jgi:hypothetical protein
MPVEWATRPHGFVHPAVVRDQSPVDMSIRRGPNHETLQFSCGMKKFVSDARCSSLTPWTSVEG